MEELGPYIRRRRHELGLNLEQCASKTGITLQALSQIELVETKQPKATTLVALAGALEVDVQELLKRLEVPA